MLTRLRAQVQQAWALLSAAATEPPERKRAQMSIAFTTLLPDAMEVLERRRLAGTLLYGKCAPHEVEWARQIVGGDSPEMPRDTVEVAALLTGYETFLIEAYLALACCTNAEILCRRRSRGRRSLAS
jgi:hypothetical protein